ncbi:MAG: MBL fold metallo-hydrolase [Planctomycetes bacterium]|nr:MBL fold metallo-hydrolase [Planctomycetota bacterium]
MIVVRSEHPRFLSNSYLVADEPGGKACIVDTGADPAPLVAAVGELDLEVDWVLLTHHHHDHTEHNTFWSERYTAPLCGHRNEVVLFGDLDRLLEHEETIHCGGLEVTSLFLPGHTLGQLGYHVRQPSTGEARVFTGDTLFKGSIGGTRGPGHTTHYDLKRSIMDRLMSLDHDTLVMPGHSVETTLGAEWETNPFVRYWRDLDEPLDEPCRVFGEVARLLVRATDYDGGTKCIVRWRENGELDVVPGSRVEPLPASESAGA